VKIPKTHSIPLVPLRTIVNERKEVPQSGISVFATSNPKTTVQKYAGFFFI
jgi:hypothetical protein